MLADARCVCAHDDGRKIGSLSVLGQKLVEQLAARLRKNMLNYPPLDGIMMLEQEDDTPASVNQPELNSVVETFLGSVTSHWLPDEGMSWTSSTASTAASSCSSSFFEEESGADLDRDLDSSRIKIRTQFDEVWPEDLKLLGRGALSQMREAHSLKHKAKVIVSL